MDNPVASCDEAWLAYVQCRCTRGFDCVLLSSNAAVCAGTSAETPNWGTRKVGVDPPSGCVAIDATDYCCPAEWRAKVTCASSARFRNPPG